MCLRLSDFGVRNLKLQCELGFDLASFTGVVTDATLLIAFDSL